MVSTQDITLPADGESETVQGALQGGRRRRRGRSGSASRCRPNEEVTQNNQRDSLIDVYDRPREDPLSRRRAAARAEVRPAGDRGRRQPRRSCCCSARPRPRSTRRTSTCRLGVDDAEELQDGFPTTREELFAYRGIILGSVEAAAFTPEQQRMLEDFVDVRGGGLLVLGGPRSFSEGGWAGTPLSDALPVVLDRRAPKPLSPPLELVVRPTRAGAVASGDADHRAAGGRARRSGGAAAADGRERRAGRRPQARRDALLTGARSERPRAGGAGVSAVRPRQGARAARAGHLDVADARQDGRRGHDAPQLLAAAHALARGRRAGSRHGRRRRPTACSRASRSR